MLILQLLIFNNIKYVYDTGQEDAQICKYDTRTNCCTLWFQNNSEPVLE